MACVSETDDVTLLYVVDVPYGATSSLSRLRVRLLVQQLDDGADGAAGALELELGLLDLLQ